MYRLPDRASSPDILYIYSLFSLKHPGAKYFAVWPDYMCIVWVTSTGSSYGQAYGCSAMTCALTTLRVRQCAHCTAQLGWTECSCLHLPFMRTTARADAAKHDSFSDIDAPTQIAGQGTSLDGFCTPWSILEDKTSAHIVNAALMQILFGGPDLS